MTEPEGGERDRLRTFFRDLHEALDPPAPHYRSLTGPDASAGRTAPRNARPRTRAGAVLARALALTMAAGFLVLAIRGGWRRATSENEALRLVASLGDWQAPTDFLLQTPGVEFFESAPRLGTEMETVTGERTDLIQTEVSQ